jgi:2,3-bisphosphoglycerate-independent phosphoglycerate mutase
VIEMAKKPVMLIIMDGWGLSDIKKGNAIENANLPNYQNILEKYPHNRLFASGLEVGLPNGQMGNSEVGHLNIGAGRVVYQELTRITKSIEDGDLFENTELCSAFDAAIKNGTSLHLYGLLSDGGVHSHNTHLYGLLQLAKKKGLDKVYVHAFMDGRDTPPSSGKQFVEELEAKIREIGVK